MNPSGTSSETLRGSQSSGAPEEDDDWNPSNPLYQEAERMCMLFSAQLTDRILGSNLAAAFNASAPPAPAETDTDKDGKKKKKKKR